MISSTLATLEWTAQVTSAAITMHRTGSPVMEDITTRTPGAFSAGANVSSRMCSDSSISPRPIKTRPMSLMRGRGAALEQRRQPETGGKCVEAITKRLAEQPSQVRAKGTQNPAVDHVQAPQQQRHAAHQIEQYQRSHAPSPDWSRLVRLAPNAGGSNHLLAHRR